ncbi:MAG: hypothetical protein ACRCT1_12720 [Microcoleaceae cyanobacterium]
MSVNLCHQNNFLEGRRKREEGRRKREEGRRKRAQGNFPNHP